MEWPGMLGDNTEGGCPSAVICWAAPLPSALWEALCILPAARVRGSDCSPHFMDENVTQKGNYVTWVLVLLVKRYN